MTEKIILTRVFATLEEAYLWQDELQRIYISVRFFITVDSGSYRCFAICEREIVTSSDDE